MYINIIVLFLVFFTNPLFAQLAIEPSGSGLWSDPYLITSLENLYWVACNQLVWESENYFSQTADIFADETINWFEGAGWTPIGSESHPFNGCYMGNGHVIRSLHLNRPSESNCGLFGVSTGQISCLGVTINLMQGWENVGAIVGHSYGVIEECYSSSADSGGDIYGWRNVGGIAGCLEYVPSGFWGPGRTDNCYSTCDIYGWSKIGGITGNLINATLRYNYYSGRINPSGTDISQCGAVVGVSNNGQVQYCYWNINTANIGHSAGGEPRSVNQMTTLYPLDTYVNWDFNNVWAFDTDGTENDGLPFLGNPTPPLVSSVPSPVTLISPLDNSQLIGINCVGLRWQFSLSPGWTDYMRGAKCYVGTDNPPTNLMNGWDVGFVNGISPYVQLDTTYYWQIVPYNELGNAINCPVWSFSTHSITLQLLVPNGGELWMSGTTQMVQWSSNAPISLNLLFSYDGGYNWYEFSSVDGTKQYCYLQVPFVNSTNCRLKIVYSNNNSILDVSDASFRISTSSTLPKVVLSYPSSSGLTFAVGQTIDISWIRQQTALVDLYFSTDDGVSWEPIIQNLDDDSYSWTIPDLISSSCRIKVSNASNSAVSDVSDHCFGIGKIQLLSPIGGECITSDYSSTSIYPISWTSTNVSSVKLEYSSDNGSSWTIITAGTEATSGTYSWTVPSITSNQYLIRISDTSNPLINDYSTNPFTVQVPVIILNANGGGFITNNSLFTIRWRNVDVPSGSFIMWLYSLTNGSYPWFRISSYEGVPSDQGYIDWFVNTGELSSLVLLGRLVGTDRIIAKSASSITVTDNYLRIIEPNGGECYTPGSSQIVRWDSWGVSSINIFLSTDDGASWQNIGSNIPASNANYQWIVPNSPSTTCRIKLADINVNYMNLFSDNPFSILSQMIPSPVSGVQLEVDQSDVVVSWNAVTQDIYGTSIQPDAYIVSYAFEPDADVWIILTTTTDLQAIHIGAANHYDRIFYRVRAVLNSVNAP